MAEWWARHTERAASSSSEEASTPHTDDDIVEDTAAAFRTALRRTDDVESAADVQGDAAIETDDAPSDSLDYFGPAFRQALGDEEGCREECHRDAHTAETRGEGAQGTPARSEEEAPAESLNYFVPALPSGSGREEQAEAVSGAFVEMGEEMGEDTEETENLDHSLDYFAPAFRRALGEEQRSDSDPIGLWINEEMHQGAAEQLKEVMEGISERAEVSDFDLNRLTEPFFASTSRKLVGLNGG